VTSRASRSATAQVVLEGVTLPASKRELLSHAARNGGEDAGVMQLLRELPGRQYTTLDEVGEVLAPVQPAFSRPPVRVPPSHSGAPPGGDAYVQAHAEPGWIRGEPEVLEYEQELVRGPGGARVTKGAQASRPDPTG
jgi:Protein of unknown function (DUF2795)